MPYRSRRTLGGDSQASLGTETITRVVVAALARPKPGHENAVIPVSEAKMGFAVEFDTTDGQIKGFVFVDPRLTELFCRGQRR
jgi:hypothetical protein